MLEIGDWVRVTADGMRKYNYLEIEGINEDSILRIRSIRDSRLKGRPSLCELQLVMPDNKLRTITRCLFFSESPDEHSLALIEKYDIPPDLEAIYVLSNL